MAEEIQSVLSFKQQLRAKDDTLERMRHQGNTEFPCLAFITA